MRDVTACETTKLGCMNGIHVETVENLFLQLDGEREKERERRKENNISQRPVCVLRRSFLLKHRKMGCL